MNKSGKNLGIKFGTMPVGSACPATKYDIMLRRLDDGLIGILLTRPNLETGKKILKDVEYLDENSEKFIDLYFAGYSTEEHYPESKEVAEVDGTKWYFSNKKFKEFKKEIEKICKWKYSGESDLILISCKEGKILYEEAMMFHLEKLIKEGVFGSVEEFFEELVRICSEKRTIKEISNAFGAKKVKHTFLKIIVDKLPAGLGELFTQEKNFCVKNIAK